MLSWVRGITISLVLVAVAGALLSSTFVLNDLPIDGPIPFGDRVNAGVGDLLQFGPTYAAVLAAPWIILLGLTGFLARTLAPARPVLMALAGAAAVAVVLVGLERVFGQQVIAGARAPLGFAAQLAAGAVCGLLFALIHRPAKP